MRNQQTPSAHEIATYLLAIYGNLSVVKLVRILYYAQGFTLALTGKPLFRDAIEVWTNGPTVPDVFYRFVETTNGIIDANGDRCASSSTIILNARLRTILDDVWATYGRYSGFELSRRSQGESPLRKTELSQEISHDLLVQFFSTQTLATVAS